MIEFRPHSIDIDINLFNVVMFKSRGLEAKVMDVDVIPFSDHTFDSVLTNIDKVIDRLFTKESLLDKRIAARKISVPRAMLCQNLENLIAITFTNTISK